MVICNLGGSKTDNNTTDKTTTRAKLQNVAVIIQAKYTNPVPSKGASESATRLEFSSFSRLTKNIETFAPDNSVRLNADIKEIKTTNELVGNNDEKELIRSNRKAMARASKSIDSRCTFKSRIAVSSP